MTLLAVGGLTVGYGSQRVLGPVSLDLAPGERLAVIGQSGSGKSTLALAIAGLLPPGAVMGGKVTWPVLGSAVPGRDVGFVFQDAGASLDPLVRVGDQIAEVLAAHTGLTRVSRAARVADLLARVGLPAEAARAYPHRLSGGQRQRAAIACAIAAGPRLLIADEATSALDTLVQAHILGLLDSLVRDSGMALLFITHDIALAATMADRLAVMEAGQVVEHGRAATVVQGPRHAATRALLAAHIDMTTPPLVGTA
jgi:peptide/nickel transport system ATP-binding protein